METTPFEFSDRREMVPHYCGLDVHKYQLAVAVYARDDAGVEFLKCEIFGTDARGLEMFWGFVSPYKPVQFAMEATNVYHHVICTFLDDKKLTATWRYSVDVFNPADAAGMPGRQKNDRVDATWIARYLAAGLLKGGRAVIPVLEDLRGIFRSAHRLERDRTALKNRIKKTLDRAGFRPRGFNLNAGWICDFLFHLSDHEGTIGEFISAIKEPGHVLSNKARIIAKYEPIFEPYTNVSLTTGQKSLIRQDIVELEFKTARIAFLAVEIDRAIATRPGLRQSIQAVASIPGYSAFSAAWLVSEAGPVTRYNSVSQFLVYCGCCPRTVASAGKIYHAHVTKHSNKYARTIFFNAAKVVCLVVKKPSNLKTYANRIVAKKRIKGYNLVFSTVAAKLARITYAIMIKNQMFNDGNVKSKSSSPDGNAVFTVADTKSIQRAIRILRAIESLKDSKEQKGDKAKFLADALDRMLKEN